MRPTASSILESSWFGRDRKIVCSSSNSVAVKIVSTNHYQTINSILTASTQEVFFLVSIFLLPRIISFYVERGIFIPCTYNQKRAARFRSYLPLAVAV